MIATDTQNNLFHEARQYIPGGVHSPAHAFLSVGVEPFVTERSDGAYLYTTDGRELIDFVCSFGPIIHGHNDPRIREAISKALQHGVSYATANRHGIELSKKVVELIPSIERIRMVNSGTEATMTAIRLARGYTKRDKIIKFSGCYHGHYDALLVAAGSGAVTFGNPDSAGVPAVFAKETIVLPYNDFSALEEVFKLHGDEIACVIVEPYPGNCGLIHPKPGYLQGMRDLCTQNDTVLIFDEVMTGFRVSLGGVQEKEGITPDLTALGKVIGGGLPVGAVGGKSEIMDCLAPNGPVYQAGTLSGNPLAMSAGLASLKLLEATMPYQQHEAAVAELKTQILQAASEKGIGIQVPQATSMFCMYFSETPVTNFDEALATDIEQFKKLFRYCYDNGVFLPPSPFETSFISTAHIGDALNKAGDIIADGIRQL